MQYSFSKFSACSSSSVAVSTKEEKQKGLETVLWMVSEAVAHLPAAVSQLLLEALFMQISGVSLTLTWPLRLCLLRVLLGTTATITSFPLSKHTEKVALHPPSPAGLFIYSSHGKCPFPTFQWSFPHTATFTSFPALRLLGGGCRSCLLWPACLFTVPPPSSALRVPCPLCYVSFLLLLLIQFGFFSLFSLGGGQSV
jgi:hypothetical protein